MAKKIKLEELLKEKNIDKKLKDVSFENGLELMEELVDRVESGRLELDQAVLSYEKGAQLIAHLKTLLSGAEKKLKIVQKSSKK